MYLTGTIHGSVTPKRLRSYAVRDKADQDANLVLATRGPFSTTSSSYAALATIVIPAKYAKSDFTLKLDILAGGTSNIRITSDDVVTSAAVTGTTFINAEGVQGGDTIMIEGQSDGTHTLTVTISVLGVVSANVEAPQLPFIEMQHKQLDPKPTPPMPPPPAQIGPGTHSGGSVDEWIGDIVAALDATLMAHGYGAGVWSNNIDLGDGLVGVGYVYQLMGYDTWVVASINGGQAEFFLGDQTQCAGNLHRWDASYLSVHGCIAVIGMNCSLTTYVTLNFNGATATLSVYGDVCYEGGSGGNAPWANFAPRVFTGTVNIPR